MNIKDYTLSRLIDIVVDCRKSAIWDDNTITRNTLLGNSKNENACMARYGFICAQCTPIPRPMRSIDKLLNEMEAMRYSDYCIALQIVYWWLI